MHGNCKFDMDQYKEAYRRLPHRASGCCKIKDSRQKHVDFNHKVMSLWDASYEMGEVKSKCLISKRAGNNKIDFSSYSIMKNVRQQSIITIENHYEESGQTRLVLSWVDGSLTAWLKEGGYKKCFENGVAVHGSSPSKSFRRMIVDTCCALQHLFEKDIYPATIAEKDIYMCNERQRGHGPSMKILVSQADRLFTRGDKVLREQKLWNDVRNVFDKICKETDCVMSVPAKRFIGHIGHFAVDKLEGFPDNWCWNKKACYLFSIISADSSKVRSALQKLKFDWPKGKTGAIHPILRKVIDYEKSKRHPTLYDEEDGYDYLRLCRNIVKHWISLCKSVKFLQQSCGTVQDFLRMIESWTPDIWCVLYEQIGWPKVKA